MKVAVVGCGLAGLRSAMLLEAQGHEVLLFEGRDRPGGRVHTSPTGFEEGAEWVDEDHTRMRALMHDLGVAEEAAPDGEYLLHFQGDRRMESGAWPEAAEDLRLFEAMADARQHGETIGDLANAACRSEAGRWLVNASIRTDEGDEPSKLGLAPWLAFRSMYALREGREASAFRIGGGGTAFIERLLGKIRAAPRYNSRLLRVEDQPAARLAFDGFEVETDAAVLALSLPCLLDVAEALPQLDDLKRLGFAASIKARFVFAEPFWLGEGWQGYLKSDTVIQQTWPDRENPNALVSYIVGDDARSLGKSGEIESELMRAWDNFGVQPTEIEVKHWTADPFARGAFSLAAPGSNPAAARERASGRVQYAGEFAAAWMGFMEGALESAETAVTALS